MQEVDLGCRVDNDQTVGLGDLRGDLRQVLGPRYPDRDWQTEFVPDAAPDRSGNFGRWAEEMLRSGNVGKSLVDGDPLDQGREVTQHRYGGVAEPLIVLEVTTDKYELRAKLAGSPSRHSASDAECLGLIRCREDNPAADRNGLAAERGIEQLLDRGVEGVEVRMEDGGLSGRSDNLSAALVEGHGVRPCDSLN